MSDEHPNARLQEQFASALDILTRRLASVMEAADGIETANGRAALTTERMKLTGAITLLDQAIDDLLFAPGRRA